jgi:hypothetical protein
MWRRALMRRAQQEFDARAAPLCPEQLTAPSLRALLSCEALKPHVWGGKGVGSQGDGTAQLLCRSAEDQARVCEIVGQQLGLAAMPLTVNPQAASE